MNDGGTRIQCIKISINNPILLISIYLPTRVENDRFEEFSDCLDQLYEIIQNFETTHEIIVGGDFNEDFSKYNNSRRANKMKTTMKECNLQTNFKGPTVINTQGIDVSEIDYFFFNKSDRISYRLTDIPSSVFDHHPIGVNIQCSLQKVYKGKIEKKTKRIKWDNVDKERYQEVISGHIETIEEKLKVNNINFNDLMKETTEMLTNSANICSKRRDYGKNILKLKIWNKEIAHALYLNKQVYKQL